MKKIGGYRPRGSFRNLIGQRFGRLEVQRLAGKTKSGRTRWLCECDCTNLVIVTVDNLTRGHTKSCGCFFSEKIKKPKSHGLSGTRVYWQWNNIMNRCYDESCPQFQNYGGRGIKVNQSWHNVAQFYKDVGDPPTQYHSLDRINNNGDYSKENCRWATPLEQSKNRRSNIVIEYNDKKMILSDWARFLGVSRAALESRLKLGWSISKTLETPLKKINRNQKIEFNGKNKTFSEWSKEFGLKSNVLWNRVKILNWDFEKALKTPLYKKERSN